MTYILKSKLSMYHVVTLLNRVGYGLIVPLFTRVIVLSNIILHCKCFLFFLWANNFNKVIIAQSLQMNLFKHISVFVNFVYHNADYFYEVAMPPCYGDDWEFTVICMFL